MSDSFNTSTFAKPKLARANYMSNYELDINDEVSNCPNFFNRKIIALSENVELRGTKTYTNNMTFTTFVWFLEDNTTAWWIYLMLSGIIHPLLIENGTIFAVPDIAAMQEFEKSIKNSNTVTKVTI